jgi:plasmid stabilization system protein ParE
MPSFRFPRRAFADLDDIAAFSVRTWSHVIFYRLEEAGGILVCRILHRRMRPQNHPMDDDEYDL